MKKCPYCHAELQDEASFCLYCMHNLTEKENVEAPKKRVSKRIKIIICAVLAVVIAVSAVTFVFLNNRKICNYDDFKLALQLTSERFECDDIWNPSDLKDYLYGDNWVSYSLPIHDENLCVWIFFYNKGEEIFATVENATEKTMPTAVKLATCIIDSVYNNYLTETEDFLKNEHYYPYTEGEIDYPDHVQTLSYFSGSFDSDEYGKAQITSKYKKMVTEGSDAKASYQLYTAEYEDAVFYDMLFYFYK